jgi:hypothetical protein
MMMMMMMMVKGKAIPAINVTFDLSTREVGGQLHSPAALSPREVHCLIAGSGLDDMEKSTF